MRRLLAHRKQFFVYVLGGVLCALIDIGAMEALIAAGQHYTFAASAGFAAGLAVNYWYHTKLTFQSNAHPANFARYLCVVALNYGLTLACVAASVAMADWALPGKIVSLPIVALVGFILGKIWIYR
jgi:putative flippase GtrA